MLYDPKWSETIAPVKENWQIVLQDAANILRQYGWIQSRVGNPTIGFCVVGAMLQAVAVREGRSEEKEMRLIEYADHPDYRKARNKLDDDIVRNTRAVSSIHWNDSLACGANQVIAKLEEIALAV